MKKKLLATIMVATMAMTQLVGCGASSSSDKKDDGTTKAANTATEAAAPDEGGSGELIKVGIINNDPNESGYRTANDNDLKAMFTKENGYDAKFAYSLKNEEQINSAQTMIQDGVDYLLLSAADTAGWDSVLQDAQNEGVKVILTGLRRLPLLGVLFAVYETRHQPLPYFFHHAQSLLLRSFDHTPL